MAIGDELSSIDFKSMIGGPLNAVVEAQAQSALTSVNFIKAVGFTVDEDQKPVPVMVTFHYSKPVEVTNNGVTTVEPVKYELTVPILTMLPIPFIRIEETTIDFNAKINSVQESELAKDLNIGVEAEAKFSFSKISASIKANFSYQRSSRSGSRVERTYSTAIHVRAVQDELPAGTERLLSILENAIQEVPANESSGNGA